MFIITSYCNINVDPVSSACELSVTVPYFELLLSLALGWLLLRNDGEKIENVVKFQRNMWDLLKIDVKYK